MAIINYKDARSVSLALKNNHGLEWTSDVVMANEALILEIATQYEAENAALYTKLSATWQAFHDAMFEHVQMKEWKRSGRNSKLVTSVSWQAVLDAEPVVPPRVVDGITRDILMMKEDAKKKATQASHEEEKRQRVAKQLALNARATVFLINSGVTLTDDGWCLEGGEKLCGAGSEAAGAFELVRQRMTSEMMARDEVLDISCCDECSRWNVNERRCSCGHRRCELCWGGTFEDIYYYVEAY